MPTSIENLKKKNERIRGIFTGRQQEESASTREKFQRKMEFVPGVRSANTPNDILIFGYVFAYARLDGFAHSIDTRVV